MSVLHEDGVGRGTCFGYEIRSQLDLHYLRSGTGMPLEIELGDQATAVPGDEPLLEWLPAPDLPFHGRLHRFEEKYLLWISGVGWFGIDPAGPRITVPPEADGVRREERIWGLPAILCLLGRGDLPLHAAAVEIDGRAVVLGAPRTFGKTTLAAAFARDGFRLLSEDLTCVRRGDEPHVVPGPAMLRLRHDVAEHLDVPHTTRLADADDRVHLAFTHDRRGDCEPLPIAGGHAPPQGRERDRARAGRHNGGDPRPLVAELQRANGRRSHAVLRRDHRARHVRAGLEPPPTAHVLRPATDGRAHCRDRRLKRPPCGSTRARRRGSRSASGARTRG